MRHFWWFSNNASNFFCELAQKTFFTLSCSITRVLSTESFLWSHFPLLAFWDEIVYWNLYLIVIREFWHLRGGLPERDNFALFVHFFVFFVPSTIYIFYFFSNFFFILPFFFIHFFLFCGNFLGWLFLTHIIAVLNKYQHFQSCSGLRNFEQEQKIPKIVFVLFVVGVLVKFIEFLHFKHQIVFSSRWHLPWWIARGRRSSPG